jgi:hypothetical protein
LESDSKSEDGDDNLDNTHALCTLDNDQPGHGAIDLEILPAPCNRLTDEPDDRENNIDSTSPRPTKRQRSTSLGYEPNTGTPPLLHSEDIKRSRENADGSDSDESGNDNVLPKRWKLSDYTGGRTALSSHNRRCQHSPPSISDNPEDDRVEGSGSISVDDNLASTARTTPGIFESASLTEPQQCSEVIDDNRDWEVREIIGKEYVDGVLHYLVMWCPTLEPVHSLEHAIELVDEFEAQLRTRREDKSGRGGPGLKARQQAALKADTSVGQQKQKKRRGRPRKAHVKLGVGLLLLSCPYSA